MHNGAETLHLLGPLTIGRVTIPSTSIVALKVEVIAERKGIAVG